MPHVEDRSARRDEIEYEALQRKHEETQMVEQRKQRLLEEQAQHLESLARDQELKGYELAEMLKQAQHQELQQAARVATTETQAEALIRTQAQEHAEELRKERFRTPSPKTRLPTATHTTTPLGTPSAPKEAKTERPSAPNISPINPVALPQPTPTRTGGSSSSAPAPKARATPISSSRKGTHHNLTTQKHRPCTKRLFFTKAQL